MASELTLIITEDGEEITRIRYSFGAVCPTHGSARLELTEFLEQEQLCRGNPEYLAGASALSEILKRTGKTNELNDSTQERLKILNAVYKALKYEYDKNRRKKIIRAKQCESMIAAAYRIASIIKKSTFEALTADDFSVMKRYLFNRIPPKAELLDFPPELLEKIKPFFELLRLLIIFSPAEGEKQYIDSLIKLLYDE